MIIYALVAIAPLLLSVFFPRMNEVDKRKRKYLIICGIILVLFLGLRSKYVGSTDSLNYFNLMKKAVANETWNGFYNPEGVETGFQFFVFVLSRIFKAPQMLFVATSAFYVSAVLYCIYKNSDNVVLSTIMYITLGLMQFQMQGMRQAMAMAVCMFAFEFVKKKKLIPFLLLAVLALQFHRTSFVIIAIYLVSLLSYNFWSLLLLAIGSGVVFAYTDQLMAFANEVFETDYAQTIDSGGFVATAIYVLIIVFAMIFNRRVRYDKEDKTQSTIMFVTILGMVSYIMRYFGAGISERISFYFMFGQMLLLPNTLETLKIEYKKIITAGIYFMCFILFIYRLRGSDFLPYEFFWSTL